MFTNLAQKRSMQVIHLETRKKLYHPSANVAVRQRFQVDRRST